MKEVLLSTLLIFTTSNFTKATITDIGVDDFSFSIVSFDAAVGDTVRWILVAGTHTTTSTLVPSGASIWDYTFTDPGDSFTYVITVPGVYEYQCSFHPILMRGSFATPSPLPFLENFEYPADDLLAYHGWVNHSGTGQFVKVFNGNLSFSGYPASGIGNHVQLFGGSGSREDIHRGFENISSGACYAAFLINVSSSTVSAGYVAHFMPPIGNVNYRARFFMFQDFSNVFFGISKGSSTNISWAGGFPFPQTYLIVLKYEYVGDATGSDDIVKLWVDPDLLNPEPVNGDVENIDMATDEELENFAIRQGSEAHEYQFDGLTISNTWAQLVPVDVYVENSIPIGYTLHQNYPNPFNPTTSIKFRNAEFGFVSLKVYDVLGNEIVLLVNEEKPAGSYEINFDGYELTNGIYFYRLHAGDFIEIKKMVLMK